MVVPTNNADWMDDKTRGEVLAAVFILNESFEAAAKDVDTRFPGIDAENRQELVGIVGEEYFSMAAEQLDVEAVEKALALRAEGVTDVDVIDTREGRVAELLRAAQKPSSP